MRALLIRSAGHASIIHELCSRTRQLVAVSSISIMPPLPPDTSLPDAVADLVDAVPVRPLPPPFPPPADDQWRPELILACPMSVKHQAVLLTPRLLEV
jgi:hypothetical protein